DHRRERADRYPAGVRARRPAAAAAQLLPRRRGGHRQGAALGGEPGPGGRKAFPAAALAAIVSLASAAPANEEELKALRARIDKLQRDLTAAEESRGEATDQLK